ncbi:MAG: hypothetical protein PWP53_1005 [Lacrimispora sp.]|nr:hypothetical protein [Lacrimispora sp.]
MKRIITYYPKPYYLRMTVGYLSNRQSDIMKWLWHNMTHRKGTDDLMSIPFLPQVIDNHILRPTYSEAPLPPAFFWKAGQLPQWEARTEHTF